MAESWKATTAEVHFHNDGAASCVLATEATGDTLVLVHEFCLWASMASHQYCTMGPDGHKLAQLLMEQLSLLPQDLDPEDPSYAQHVACIVEGKRDELLQDAVGEPILREHSDEAKRRFLAQMTPYGDEGFRFNLDMKGFGWLGRGLDRYCPQSVMLLLRFLYRRYSEDPKKMAALLTLSVFMGISYVQNHVSMRNKVMHATMKVIAIMGMFGWDADI